MAGFAQNLIEGFAGAAGDQNTVNRLEREKANKQALSHAELQTQTQSILDDVGGLQKRRAALDPKSPTYAQDIGDIDANLHKARQALTDLYHPANNPGALQHLGGFIKAHLGKGKPRAMDEKVRPGDFRNRDMIGTIAGLDAAAAMPGQADSSNPYADQIRNLEAVGISHEDAVRSVREKAGLEAKETPTKFQPQLTTTTDAQGKTHYWRVPLEAGGKPEEVDFQGQTVQPKAGAPSNSKFSQEAAVYENKWGKKIKDWTPEQLTYFNQKMAYDSQHSGASTTTKLEKDEFGVIRPVEVTTTRGPIRPPVEPGTVPQTAGAAKARLAGVAPRSAASSVKVGNPLPFTGTTPSITKARNDYDEATKLSSIADQVSKRPDDAVNQKRLAVALERASAGRFTTQALDYIIKAGWGNTIEQWANNPTTGALPSDVLRQLVDGAHQNLQGAREALNAAHGPAAGGTPTTAQPSGKAVSLAKAKQLPAMKGKTDDQIRQAIEQSGHQVIP